MNLKRFIILGGALTILVVLFMLTFHQVVIAQYTTKTYRKQGGDEFVVANGGRITIETGGSLVLDNDTLYIARAEGNVAAGDSIIKVPVAGCDSSDMALVTLNSAVIGKVMWAFPRVDTVDIMIDMNPADTVSISVQVWKD